MYAPFQRRGSSPITIVIVSLGMALIIEFGIAGASSAAINVSYTMSQGPTLLSRGLNLTAVQLVIIAISVVVMAGAHVLLRYTKLGKAMRATAANRSCPQLRHQDQPGHHRHLGADRRPVRPGRTVFAIDIGSFGPTSTDIFVVLILPRSSSAGPAMPTAPCSARS